MSNTPEVIEDDPIEVRKAKRQAMLDAGQNPYGHAFDYSHHLAELEQLYAHLEDGDSTEDLVKVAGRIMSKRVQGKIAFLACATPRATCNCSAASMSWAKRPSVA